MSQIIYPVTSKGDVSDTYFNTKVNDPYRWLEDDRSVETGNWVTAQNNVTFDYLKKIPSRQKFQKAIEEKMNYPKYGAPFRKGAYYYYYKNDGLQNQSVLIHSMFS